MAACATGPTPARHSGAGSNRKLRFRLPVVLEHRPLPTRAGRGTECAIRSARCRGHLGRVPRGVAHSRPARRSDQSVPWRPAGEPPHGCFRKPRRGGRLRRPNGGQARVARCHRSSRLGADPVWLHGDRHPANLLVDRGRISGVIDFGDIAASDPPPICRWPGCCCRRSTTTPSATPSAMRLRTQWTTTSGCGLEAGHSRCHSYSSLTRPTTRSSPRSAAARSAPYSRRP